MAAVRGVSANHVAIALNNQMHGISWTGCSKGQMADEYALAHSNPSRCVRMSLASINLDVLGDQAKARMLGNKNWREINTKQTFEPKTT